MLDLKKGDKVVCQRGFGAIQQGLNYIVAYDSQSGLLAYLYAEDRPEMICLCSTSRLTKVESIDNPA